MNEREAMIKALADCRIKAGQMGLNAAYFDFETIDSIIALLKEQKAVEPLPQNSTGWIRTIKLWYCGACHSKISRRTSKYCPNCGKPILWKGRIRDEKNEQV